MTDRSWAPDSSLVLNGVASLLPAVPLDRLTDRLHPEAVDSVSSSWMGQRSDLSRRPQGGDVEDLEYRSGSNSGSSRVSSSYWCRASGSGSSSGFGLRCSECNSELGVSASSSSTCTEDPLVTSSKGQTKIWCLFVAMLNCANWWFFGQVVGF